MLTSILRVLLKKISNVSQLGFAALVSILIMPTAFAALPTVSAPGNVQASSTDWMDWMTQGFDEMLTLIGLIVATIGMIMVVWKVLKAYQEVGNGRGDWGDVATAATGGALVMMVGAGVLTIAATVI